MLKMKMIKTDILVVGAGIAGCAAALESAKRGLEVLLVTKDEDVMKSSTRLAQGGIVSRPEGDTPELLVEDILTAGDGISSREAAEILAKYGPGYVEEILMAAAGVEFSREGGKLDYTKEAAHSVSRILHKNDHTGEEIEGKMIEAVRRNTRIKLMKGFTLIDLLMVPEEACGKEKERAGRKCVGALMLDNRAGQELIVSAARVVLATGGIGQVYLRTTNPDTATGDGLAAAARAGAEITNAEYVQFHPTSLMVEGLDNFLISESARGEGGVLVSDQGEPFMDRIDPRGSLAPRDVVARGVYEEMRKSKTGRVYLDMRSHMEPEFIRERFPLIYETCLGQGLDITRQLIPVAPIAHYFCGGIAVDGWGRTTLENLYAAGEVSCTGLHGANRLASTSLLEGLVWGTRCAQDIARDIKDAGPMGEEGPSLPQTTGKEEADQDEIKRYWKNIKRVMWDAVGIVRHEKDLEAAVRELERMKREIEERYERTKLSKELIELRNGVEVSVIIARAARDNKESRGCHYRID